MPAIIGLLRQRLPADTVVTNGAGNFASWVHRFWRFHGLAKGHKTQLAPTGGAIGYGVPGGWARPSPPGVWCSPLPVRLFLMNEPDLATVMQHGAKNPGARVSGPRQRHRAAQPRFRRPGPCLRLCRRARHPHRGFRGRSAGRTGTRAGYADRNSSRRRGHHHPRHAERDPRTGAGPATLMLWFL